MPSGNVSELAGRGVQNPIYERSELRDRRVERKESIQVGSDLRRRSDLNPIRHIRISDQN